MKETGPENFTPTGESSQRKSKDATLAGAKQSGAGEVPGLIEKANPGTQFDVDGYPFACPELPNKQQNFSWLL
ncbi:hypothetical protein RUM43_008950 [Polyplax serrata]|uniref:Uncharacterized protein n=1 Tax=Polyplax serrata TaxID=468196 RepID=A0AAN8PA20_POLSC